ncbi:MAG: hypothetical protein KKH98_07770 [Spirochaetes bacterium]|nr:hypothetical protein [Spirochaetota bacterium]
MVDNNKVDIDLDSDPDDELDLGTGNKKTPKKSSSSSAEYTSAEETSMEMALAVADIHNAVHQFMKGDYSVKVSKDTLNCKIDLLKDLARLVNDTIANTGGLIKELNLGITEFASILKKVQKGETSSRVESTFDNAGIQELKKLINDILTAFEEKIEENNKNSMELALGLSENFAALNEISKGNYKIKAPEKSENELLGKLGELINRTSLEISQKITEVENLKKKEEEKRKILQSSVNNILTKVNLISEGNLNVKVESQNTDDDIIVELGKGINKMVGNLKTLINQLKSTVSEITSSSSEIASTNEEIILKANEEIKLASEASTTVTELTASIIQVAENAKKVYQTAESNQGSVKEGYEYLGKTIEKVRMTNDVVDNTATNLEKLKDSAEQIHEILKIINKISEKIDLLALNAAIEASSVGEGGKRFKVVAEEMRRLADNSISSSQQIGDVLTNIQKDISDGVNMMNSNAQEVRGIMEEINKTGDLIKNIVNVFDETSNLMKEVSLSTDQQAKASAMFSNVIKKVDISANETVRGIKNSKIAIERFIEVSDNLKELSEKFKV